MFFLNWLLLFIKQRDLALRNILCSLEVSQVICKVSDFGLSKVIPQQYDYYVSKQKEQRIPVKVIFFILKIYIYF